MSRYPGLRIATWSARKQAEVRPGERCRLCGEPATHKVLGSFGYRPACTVHAKGAAAHGYPVTPAVEEE